MSNHPNIQTMEEWKPVLVRGTGGVIFLVSFLMLAALLRWSPRPFTPTQVLLLLAFGLQLLAHRRVMVWWSVIAVWVMLPHLAALGRRASRDKSDEPEPGVDGRIKAALALTVAALALVISAPGLWACGGPGLLQPARRVTDKTPWQVVLYLRQQYADHPQLKRVVFPSETIGDYLLWDLRLEPPVRVFCYTHVHLLTPEHWKECMQVKFAEPGWQETLDRHGVQFLIVENMPLYTRLMDEVRAAPERWEIVFDAPVFVAKRR
jgi:hypothetical protein